MLRSRIIGLRPSLIRFNSSTIPKSTPEFPTAAKPSGTSEKPLSSRERIELARSSIRDIFDGFLTTEENFQPIDTKPILADPRKFAALDTFHRQQVQDEVEKRLRRDWKDVPLESKRMSYYISYGNYGVREDLRDNLFADVKPEDLPFAVPSQISTVHPNGSDIVKRLPEVDPYQANEKRKEQYRKMTRVLDPISKTVVYFAAIVTLLALYRDKYVEVEKIEQLDSPLLIAEKKRQAEQDQKAQDLIEGIQNEAKSNKKWYYLWLR
jgi:hypothetical protein